MMCLLFFLPKLHMLGVYYFLLRIWFPDHVCPFFYLWMSFLCLGVVASCSQRHYVFELLWERLEVLSLQLAQMSSRLQGFSILWFWEFKGQCHYDHLFVHTVVVSISQERLEGISSNLHKLPLGIEGKMIFWVIG